MSFDEKRRQVKSMNKDKKEMWIKALRSGEYSQAYENYVDMRRGVISFCALGVLADLSDVEVNPMTCDFIKEDLEKLLSDIPEDIINNVIRMNDSRQCSFKDIADWIEENA